MGFHANIPLVKWLFHCRRWQDSAVVSTCVATCVGAYVGYFNLWVLFILREEPLGELEMH